MKTIKHVYDDENKLACSVVECVCNARVLEKKLGDALTSISEDVWLSVFKCEECEQYHVTFEFGPHYSKRNVSAFGNAVF
jgi:hypothetical protein